MISDLEAQERSKAVIKYRDEQWQRLGGNKTFVLGGAMGLATFVMTG